MGSRTDYSPDARNGRVTSRQHLDAIRASGHERTVAHRAARAMICCERHNGTRRAGCKVQRDYRPYHGTTADDVVSRARIGGKRYSLIMSAAVKIAEELRGGPAPLTDADLEAAGQLNALESA